MLAAILFGCVSLATSAFGSHVGGHLDSKESVTESTTFVPPVKSFACNGSVGNFPDPDGRCSHVFYICAPDNENGFPFVCPNGLYFDAERNRCDFFDELPQCSGKPRRNEIDENQTTTPFPFPESTFQCNGRLGNFNDPEARCSHVFYICDQSGHRHNFLCPGELYFDEEVNQCLRHDEVPFCSGTPRTQRTTAATTPVPAPDCSGRSDGVNFVFPPESVCPEFFFQCKQGQATQFFCEGNLRYDAALNSCRRPTEVAGCPKPGEETVSTLSSGERATTSGIEQSTSTVIFDPETSSSSPIIEDRSETTIILTSTISASSYYKASSTSEIIAASSTSARSIQPSTETSTISRSMTSTFGSSTIVILADDTANSTVANTTTASTLSGTGANTSHAANATTWPASSTVSEISTGTTIAFPGHNTSTLIAQNVTASPALSNATVTTISNVTAFPTVSEFNATGTTIAFSGNISLASDNVTASPTVSEFSAAGTTILPGLNASESALLTSTLSSGIAANESTTVASNVTSAPTTVAMTTFASNRSDSALLNSTVTMATNETSTTLPLNATTFAPASTASEFNATTTFPEFNATTVSEFNATTTFSEFNGTTTLVFPGHNATTTAPSKPRLHFTTQPNIHIAN